VQFKLCRYMSAQYTFRISYLLNEYNLLLGKIIIIVFDYMCLVPQSVVNTATGYGLEHWSLEALSVG
jgi:hypothetical protein